MKEIITTTGTVGNTIIIDPTIFTTMTYGLEIGIIFLLTLFIGHMLDRRLNQKIDQELNHLNDVQLDNQE